MRQLMRWGALVGGLLALLGLTQAGMLASIDRPLTDWRLAAANSPVTGSTVVVEIDSRSLAEIGVWPWPRSLYATLLDRLIKAGVNEIAFDIDFSSASSTFEDALFTAALERAGGYAWLAAFAQSDATGAMVFSRPLPEFAAQADPVLVNVMLDPVTGLAHSFPTAAADGAATIPALAAQLGYSQRPLPPVMEVDFSLDLATLPRVSFTDVLYGRVGADQLAGKQIIVGASAIELRDFFNVPRHGIIAGPVLQALALETVKTGRILVDWAGLPGLLLVAVLALGMLQWRRRLSLPLVGGAFIGLSLTGEVAALVAYQRADIIVDTASLHVGLLLLFGLALADTAYHHLVGRRAALARLQFLATHDPATGLLSRQGLLALPDARRPLTLVALQLRGMDELRALLGHELVERLIGQVAHRLAHAGFAQTARTAPSTFALVRPDDGDADRLATSVQTLCASLCGGYQVDEHDLHVDLVAGYASGLAERADLLNRAEIAMIQAGIDRVVARGFDLSDQQSMDRRRQLDRDLRKALALDQLRLIYQPQVDLRTRRIVGAETLMRWDHPELGLVSPAEFIPLAEETGLIIDLGRWLLVEACREATAWPGAITVAVNVSPIQFQQDDIVLTVERALRQSGLPPHRLELEITESSRVTDPALVRAVMWRLRDLGIRLSIDDFGTGYSSLSYFRDLPFDTVKIDQGFIRGRDSDQDRALVAAIIDLAEKMGKHTVAEGIEDERTAVMLTAQRCTYGQGYHFSRPVPQARLCEMLLEDPEQRVG